jgi:hypothetical protein
VAVAFDAQGSGTLSGWSHTNSAGGNAFVVLAHETSNGSVSAVSYGGVALTKLGFKASNTAADGVSLWGKIGSLPTGVNTITVTGFTSYAGSCSYTGAASFGTVFSNSAAGGNSSVTITSTTTGGMCVVGACDGGAGSPSSWTATSPANLRWQRNIGTGSASDNGMMEDQASAGGGSNTTVAWTQASNDWSGTIGVEILPSGGGGSGGGGVSWARRTGITQRFHHRGYSQQQAQQVFTPALVVTAGLATAVGQAMDTPDGTVLALTPGLATATAEALDNVDGLKVGLTPGLANGLSQVMDVGDGLVLAIIPGLASGTGAANAPPAIGLTPGLANGIGSAPDYLQGLTFTGVVSSIAVSWPGRPGTAQRFHHRGARSQQAQPVFSIPSITVTVTVPGTNGSSVKILVLTGANEGGGAQNSAEVTSGVLTWPLTPNGTNSLPCLVIYDETGGSSGEFTAATNNTLIDNSIQHDAFADGYYSGSVSSGTGITLGTSAPSNTNKRCGSAYEVLASGGSTPSIDASTPPVAISASNVVTTTSFTPPAGAVLVALATGNNTGTSETISDTRGLTWTQRSSFNGGGGITSIWTATVPGGGNLSVNAGLATGTGSAADWSTGLGVGLGSSVASGTGAAAQPGYALAGGLATSTGASAGPGVELTTGLATGTGTAAQPGIGLTTGLATGTGAALQPGYALAGGLATSVGASPGPGIELTTGLATGIGSAQQPGIGLTPGLATGTGAALQPGYALVGGLATSTGASPGPGIELTTGLAVGTGAASDWSTGLGIGLTPGLAIAIGSAPDYLQGLTFTGGVQSIAVSWPGRPGSAQRFHHRGARSQQAQQVFNPSGITSPALITSGFGSFPQVPAGSIIESVIAEIYQYGSDASVGPPTYQLWDGTSAQIGASVTGSMSTTPGNFDLVAFTGVSYSQLATLQLQVFGAGQVSDHGATVNVDAVGLSVLWLPNLNGNATPGDSLNVVPQFPPVTASGVVNGTATASLLAIVPTFPAVQAGFEAGNATPGDTLAIVPVFPPVTASGVVNGTATASLLAIVPTFPAVQAGFETGLATPDTLQTVAVFPPVTASGVVNATATASLLAIVPTFPAVQAGVLNGTVSPLTLQTVAVFPAVTASGTISGTATAVLLAVVSAFPAITDITGPPGYASAETTPGGGWTNPGSVTGPPDGSNATWTVP